LKVSSFNSKNNADILVQFFLMYYNIANGLTCIIVKNKKIIENSHFVVIFCNMEKKTILNEPKKLLFQKIQHNMMVKLYGFYTDN
jgi:hypothetical protein